MSQDEPNTLQAEDLILFEASLKACLERFLPHAEGSISFPQSLPEGMRTGQGTYAAVHRPEESKLLLPLVCRGCCLGVYMLQGFYPDRAGLPLSHLVPLLSLCLENLELKKRSRLDALTGLSSRETFLAAMIRNLEGGPSFPGSEPPFSMDGLGNGITAHFSLVLLNLDRFRAVNAAYGYSLGDQVLAEAAQAIEAACPGQALAGRLGADEFAVLVPDAGPKKARSLMRHLHAHLSELTFSCPFSNEARSLSWRAGSVDFPRSLAGKELRLPAREQASLLLEKGRRCLGAAKKDGRRQTYAYGDVLASGGSILDMPSAERAVVDLGSLDRAEEGQRFAVFASGSEGSQPLDPDGFKGEIILLEVGRERAIGEVLYCTAPSGTLSPGDLLLLKGDAGPEEAPARSAQRAPDAAEAFPLGLRSFLARWRSTWSRGLPFCLILCRLEEAEQAPDQGGAGLRRGCLDLARQLQGLLDDRQACIGLYGADSLIVCLEGLEPQQGLQAARDMAAAAKHSCGRDLRIGVAYHPCLDSPRSETLANCRKALEHALLLPEPGVVLFDSITLTISGDRLFAQEDIDGARQEYTRALLLDEGNTLARNSLAICCARLGLLSRSGREFRRILELEPGNLMALYNYGCLNVRLGDAEQARACFEQCLDLNPHHAFSLLRLGRLREEAGQLEEAEAMFRRALQTPEGEAAASKSLGRLAMQAGNPEQARGSLHRALTLNPQDAEALYLLARLYFEAGENPELTERLARKSLELRPGLRECAKLLEDLLRRKGHTARADALAARHMPGAGPAPG